MILGILYFNYYKAGDTITYFNIFESLSKLCSSDIKSYMKLIFFAKIPSGLESEFQIANQPRAFTFVRIVSPFCVLSGNNYWILSIYLSLFSFAGLWVLSNTLLRFYKLKPLAVMISFFIFPSVVFWSAGIMKESLIIGTMCIIISLVLNLVHKKNRLTIIVISLLTAFSLVLLYIKFYYFAALFAVLIPYSIIKYFSIKGNKNIFQISKSFRIIFLFLFIISMSFLVSLAHERLHIDTLAETLFLNYTRTIEKSNGNNMYIFEALTSSGKSFLPHTFQALSYGLFGPFLWQCKNLLSLFSGIEDTILLVFFITFLLSNLKKEKINKTDIEEVSVIIYVSILAITMAFASPNWGSLVRYKVGYLPFFLLLILNNNPVIDQLEKRWSFGNLREKKS
jgi:hypothetical protein